MPVSTLSRPSSEEPQGSHRFLYDLLPFAVVLDPAAAWQTVHLRLPYSAHAYMTTCASRSDYFEAHLPRLSVRGLRFPIRLPYTGKARSRLPELALPDGFKLTLSPQGHSKWFLLPFPPFTGFTCRDILSTLLFFPARVNFPPARRECARKA